MSKTSDKKYYELWEKLKDNIASSSPIDLHETATQKKKRIADLEKNPEEWFKYYFDRYYTSEATPWHIAASKRILKNPEWYEVRSWSRELSKSGRTMMEVIYLVLTGKKKNILMVSSTYDNAERLLAPYKAALELNERIINDYGTQQSLNKWEAGEFKTRKGVAFRAIGAGQSPRGTRNDAHRPDVILIDDIDTDEECRSKKRIKAKIKWIEEALIPTRSVSEPLLLIACGNIIAKFCCITEMGKKADKWEVINLEDKHGNSTWPQKNTPEMIARIKRMVSWSAFQKEYCNNPISEGDTFKEITYGKAPKLSSCDRVLAYADPATSNKDKSTAAKTQASHKCVIVIGYKDMVFYVYKVWLDVTGQSGFVDWMFQAHKFITKNGVEITKIWIENNSLQGPMYDQVILPLVKEKQKKEGHLPITPDTRSKPDKYFRIEGTLEPLNRLGELVFDENLKGDPHMGRMEEQMLGVSEEAEVMDGPDALEGGVHLIKSKKASTDTTYRAGKKKNRKF